MLQEHVSPFKWSRNLRGEKLNSIVQNPQDLSIATAVSRSKCSPLSDYPNATNTYHTTRKFLQSFQLLLISPFSLIAKWRQHLMIYHFFHLFLFSLHVPIVILELYILDCIDQTVSSMQFFMASGSLERLIEPSSKVCCYRRVFTRLE